MQSKGKYRFYCAVTAVSFVSIVVMWLSLDRRFLEKYYYKWQIQDWEAIEFPLLIATSVFACLVAKGLFQGLSKPDLRRTLDFDRFGWSLLIGNLIIVLATMALIVFGRDYLGRNVKELGHIAVAQELLILLALVLITAAAWKMRNSDLRIIFGLRAAWLCGVLGLALFLLLMEEISWGQHFVGWATPDAFNRNIQNETNIHNFYTNRFEFVYYSLAFVCFVLLPILAPQIRIQWFEPLKIFIPPASFGIAAIPVAGFMYENWGILIFQIYFLIGVCLAFLAATAMQGKARWSVVAVGLAMVFSQIVYLVYGHKLVSSYEIGEMRELSISFTLAAYTLWLLAETREITQRGQQGRARDQQLLDGMPNGGSASWARFVGWG